MIPQPTQERFARSKSIREDVIGCYFAVAVAFLWIPGPLGWQESYHLCDSKNLPLSLPASAPNGVLTGHSFASEKLKESTGIVTFHNVTTKKVTGIAIVVDYADQSGNISMQIPYLAMVKEGQNKFMHGLHPEGRDTLEAPIMPGAMFRLIGETFTVTKECPTQSRVVLFRLAFADGSVENWSSQGWEIQPALRLSPEFLHIANGLLTSTTNFLVRTKITREGKALDIRVSGSQSPGIVEAVKTNMDKWTFYPARSQAGPVEKEVQFLFRIFPVQDTDPRRREFVSADEVPGPVIVVDVVQEEPASEGWRIWYGWRPGNDELE